MDCFRATLSERVRAPGESLEMYAAAVSQLILEAFLDYGLMHKKRRCFSASSLALTLTQP